MTGHPPVLDARSARMRAVGPVARLPLVGARHFVAAAFGSRTLRRSVGRQAKVVANAHLGMIRFHAENRTVLHTFTARFGTLAKQFSISDIYFQFVCAILKIIFSQIIFSQSRGVLPVEKILFRTFKKTKPTFQLDFRPKYSQVCPPGG